MPLLNLSDKSEREQAKDKLFWEWRQVRFVNTNNTGDDWNGFVMKCDSHAFEGYLSSEVNRAVKALSYKRKLPRTWKCHSIRPF